METDFNKYKEAYNYIEPPGLYHDWVTGTSASQSINVYAFDNHRFLFYALATFDYTFPPPEKIDFLPLTLISFDYHCDLVPPYNVDITNLGKVNLTDRKDVAFFTWNSLSPQNDNHIKSAMYLNMLSDAFILCKEERDNNDPFVDQNGNTHNIDVFTNFENFKNEILQIRGGIVLDIDLDYFMDKRTDQDGHERNYIDNYKKYMIFFRSPANDWLKIIADKIKLITIAKEPGHCGSMVNSNILFNELLSCLFTGRLFCAHNSSARINI